VVIAEDASWDGSARVSQALHDAARAVSLPSVAWVFSVHAVESFFVAEIDPDHIDLTPAA
jgi:hypothetical protein